MGTTSRVIPIGPALVALPFTIPQMLVLDRTHPGWETSDPDWFDTIAKRSAAAITTLAALALLVVLRKLGLGRDAWLAATAAALGSNLWSTASQSLWQHGPAALMLTLLMLLLWPENPSRWRFFAAGLTAAMLVCSSSDRSRVRRHDRPLGHDPASARPDLVPASGGGDRGRAHRLQPCVSRRRRRILFDRSTPPRSGRRGKKDSRGRC